MTIFSPKLCNSYFFYFLCHIHILHLLCIGLVYTRQGTCANWLARARDVFFQVKIFENFQIFHLEKHATSQFAQAARLVYT